MANTDKRKQSLYFPEEMLKEIQDEANRQDRSLSWIVQQAWRIARTEIMRFPSVNDVLESSSSRSDAD
ncbi:MAG: TIGR04563 family protein [Myxococcota bacterium]